MGGRVTKSTAQQTAIAKYNEEKRPFGENALEDGNTQPVEVEEVLGRLRSEGIDVDQLKINFDLRSRLLITQSDAKMVFDQAQILPPLQPVLEQYMENGKVMKEGLHLFLKTELLHPEATTRDVERFARSNKLYEQYTYENLKTISPLSVQEILFSDYNTIMSPAHRIISQDMSRPLSDYYIFSSCSTFISRPKHDIYALPPGVMKETENESDAVVQAHSTNSSTTPVEIPRRINSDGHSAQSKFKAAARKVMAVNTVQSLGRTPEFLPPPEAHWVLDRIADVLKAGARFLEVDCWDAGDHPSVYVQFGVKDLKLRPLLYTILKHAWSSSDFPFILSLDVRCNRPSQKLIAKHLIEVFGGHLAGPFQSKTTLPSPQLLRRKILIECVYRQKADSQSILERSGIVSSRLPSSISIAQSINRTDSDSAGAGESNDVMAARRASISLRRRSLVTASMKSRRSMDVSNRGDDKAGIDVCPATPVSDGGFASANSLLSRRNEKNAELTIQIIGNDPSTNDVSSVLSPLDRRQSNSFGRMNALLQHRASLARRSSSVSSFHLASEQSAAVSTPKSELEFSFRSGRPNTTTLGTDFQRLDSDLLKIMHFERMHSNRSAILNGEYQERPVSGTAFFDWDEYVQRMPGRLDVVCRHNLCGISDMASVEAKNSSSNVGNIVSDATLQEGGPDVNRVDFKIREGDPFTAWIAGVQLVSLNLESDSPSIWDTVSLFVGNGQCGYILKPRSLRNISSTTSKTAGEFDLNQVLSNITQHQKNRQEQRKKERQQESVVASPIKQSPMIPSQEAAVHITDIEDDFSHPIEVDGGIIAATDPQSIQIKEPASLVKSLSQFHFKGNKGVWLDRVASHDGPIDRNSVSNISLWMIGCQDVLSTSPPVCEVMLRVKGRGISHFTQQAIRHGKSFYWDSLFSDNFPSFSLEESLGQVIFRLWDPSNETVPSDMSVLKSAPKSWNRLGMAVYLLDYLRMGIRCVVLRQNPRIRNESGRLLVGIAFSS